MTSPWSPSLQSSLLQCFGTIVLVLVFRNYIESCFSTWTNRKAVGVSRYILVGCSQHRSWFSSLVLGWVKVLLFVVSSDLANELHPTTRISVGHTIFRAVFKCDLANNVGHTILAPTVISGSENIEWPTLYWVGKIGVGKTESSYKAFISFNY